MRRYSLTLLAVVASLSAAPLSAQQPQPTQPSAPARATTRAQVPAGPRLNAEFQRYQPAIGRNDAAAAAAASRTTITISTLGLVLLAILLIILLA